MSLDPAASFEPPAEPLALQELPAPDIETLAGVRARRFEISCRGDRARLDLLSPDTAGPLPTLLVQPPPADAGELAALQGVGAWLSAGIAVASLTLPLFGSRRSPKLSAKLESAVAAAAAGRALSETDRVLWSEFTRQSVLELRRAVDALEEAFGAAPAPLAFAGAGLGADLGALFCAADPRPAAAVLAGLGKAGPNGLSPERALRDVAPRPVHRLDGAEADWLDRALSLLSPEPFAR